MDARQAALEAFKRGWVAVPLKPRAKQTAISAWSNPDYADSSESVAAVFDRAQAEYEDPIGIGLVLGQPSCGLVDIDLDRPSALRLRDIFLPDTPMMSGRMSTARSHLWYLVTAPSPDEFPATRRINLPRDPEAPEGDKRTLIELRSTGGQTVIPPSIHDETGEAYEWYGEPWGGEAGPTVIDADVLQRRVAALAMTAVLLESWPHRGGRHDAYLALAGTLLRYGESDNKYGGVNPFWEANLAPIIRALAEQTHDDEEPETRVRESMDTTIRRLKNGGKVAGLPTLAGILGDSYANLVRSLALDVEKFSGWVREPDLRTPVVEQAIAEPEDEESEAERDERLSALPLSERNPLEERRWTWEALDIAPYLAGTIEPPQPTILPRSDGLGLFYPGRVNSLYGASESGKTWVALSAIGSVLQMGQRAMMIDCEDDPQTALLRLQSLGLAPDEIARGFSYIRPEDPIATMQFDRYGEPKSTEKGRRNEAALDEALSKVAPDLIVVDGITALYGMHGLNTNDASNTDTITSWLKVLCGNGRRSVIIIDHTSKGAGPGSTPMGSQHKVAMIQGTALQVYPVTKPRIGAPDGEMILYIGKDRPGVLRGASPEGDPQIAAHFLMDSSVEKRVKIRIDPGQPGTAIVGATEDASRMLAKMSDDADLIEHAIRTLGGGWMSKSEILLQTAGDLRNDKGSRWRDAIKFLTSSGRVEHNGSQTKAARYRLPEAAVSGD